VARPKSSEGLGCGIPPFAKCAKDGAPSGAEPRFLFVRFTRRLSTALPRYCMGSARLACGTTDVVPFLGLALSESSEGWGCGIPRLAKDARHGGTLGSTGAKTTSTGAEARLLFVRFTRRLSAALPRCCMDSAWSACGMTDVVPFPGVARSESSEGWDCGIPRLAKDARHGAPWFAVASAYSRFLDSARSSILRMIFLR